MNEALFYILGLATFPAIKAILFVAYLIRVALHDIHDVRLNKKPKYFFWSIKETFYGCMRGAWRVID